MAYISKKELAEIQENRLKAFDKFQMKLMEDTNYRYLAYKEEGKSEEHSFKVKDLQGDSVFDFEFKAGPYGWPDKFRCKGLNKFAEYSYFQGYDLIAENLNAIDKLKDIDKETFDLLSFVSMSANMTRLIW